MCPFSAGRHLLSEMRGAFRSAADARSLYRLGADLLIHKAIRFVPKASTNQERRVRLRGGVDLCYRLNRGDIQSIREVWYEGAYRLPFALDVKVAVDLGAQIGLASVWLHRRHECKQILAVEPSPSNVRIAQINFALNNVPGEIVQAAIGPRDGDVFFEEGMDSNRGRIGAGTLIVPMVSMTSLLERHLRRSRVDLVKMDIEGGEQALLDGDLAWMDRVQALIVEFHPSLVDYPGLVRKIEHAGFRYIRSGSVFPGNADCFVRE